MTIATLNPATNGDDAGIEAGGAWYDLSVQPGISLGNVGVLLHVGFRFPSTGIPQGATINDASLQLATITAEVGSTFGVAYGDDVDSPVVFSGTNRVTTRTKTTASTLVTSANKTDIDVTAIVQELVNRASFGGTIAILLDATGVSSGTQIQTSSSTLTDYDLVVDYTAGSSDVDVSAATEGLTITPQSAGVALDVGVSAGVEALTITAFAAGVTLDADVSASAAALSIATSAAGVGLDANVQASAAALSIAGQVAAISADAEVGAQAAALTITTQSAAIALDEGIQAGLAPLVLATNAAGVTLDANIAATTEALSITTAAASVQFGENVLAAPAALALSPQAAAIGFDADIQAAPAALSIAAHRASIDAGNEVQQPGGFLPVIYLDRDGNEVSLTEAKKEVKQAAREAIKKAPRKVRRELRKTVENVIEAPRLDLSRQIDAIRRELAQIDLMLVEIFEIRAIRVQFEYDEEAAFLLLVA